MAERVPVSLTVGGQTLRVVSSAPEGEVRRLASIVDVRIRALTPPGRAVQPSAMLLAAMSLVSELEDERAARVADREESRSRVEAILARIDVALEADRVSMEKPADGSDDRLPG